MTIVEVKKTLTSKFITRAAGKVEIKCKCSSCRKVFFIDLGTVASEWKRQQKCECSSCGTLTLNPVEMAIA